MRQESVRVGVSWLGFATSGTATRTALHFFPSAGGVSAPYVAHCTISIFGNGVAGKSIALEGARLSQPDGLWLEDAFPELRNANGLVGVRVLLNAPQQRVDMTTSGCVIELQSSQYLARYQPPMIDVTKNQGNGTLINDGFWKSSLIFVNEKEEQLSPVVRCVRADREGNSLVSTISVNAVPGLSVTEVALPEGFFAETSPTECSFGLLRAAGVEVDPGQFGNKAGAFLVYRDAVSGEIVSASVL